MEAWFLDVHYIEWEQTIIYWEVFHIWDKIKICIKWSDEVFQWKVTWIKNHIIELGWEEIEINSIYKAERIKEPWKTLKSFKNWLLKLL